MRLRSSQFTTSCPQWVSSSPLHLSLSKKNRAPPPTSCLQIPSAKNPSSSLTSCAFHRTAGHSPTELPAPDGRHPFPPGNGPNPQPQKATQLEPGWTITALQRSRCVTVSHCISGNPFQPRQNTHSLLQGRFGDRINTGCKRSLPRNWEGSLRHVTRAALRTRGLGRAGRTPTRVTTQQG